MDNNDNLAKIEFLQKQNEDLRKKIADIKTRSLAVYEENQTLKNFPEIIMEKEMMKFQMEQASIFIKSRAFPNITPEQAVVIMMSGREQGLSPLKALNSLYIVKGAIQPYGKYMVEVLSANGYTIEYIDEKPTSVTVQVTKGDWKRIEFVDSTELLKMGSKAYKFAPKNKMRYHGIRRILNFHLPHLIGGISDIGDADFVEFTDVEPKNNQFVKAIKQAKTYNELKTVEEWASKHGDFDAEILDKKKELVKKHIQGANTATGLSAVSNVIDALGDSDLEKLFYAKKEMLTSPEKTKK